MWYNEEKRGDFMIGQWVYETFGPKAAEWVANFAIYGTWQNTMLNILIVLVPLIIRVGIIVLIIILLIKGIKYLSKKNKGE